MNILSGGRFELGPGAGASWDAIVAYGGPRRTLGGAPAALEEAIDVIGLMASCVDRATSAFDELTALALEHGVDSIFLWPDGDLVEQTGPFAGVAAARLKAVAATPRA